MPRIEVRAPDATRISGSPSARSIARAAVSNARHLNGFSPLSSRSRAISSRTAAACLRLIGIPVPSGRYDASFRTSLTRSAIPSAASSIRPASM